MIHCYICDRAFDGVTVVDHGEHVIQNGVGGGILAWGILCETCGAGLGRSVDAPFIRAMAPICASFDLRRDRGGPVGVRARVTLASEFAGNGDPVVCTVEHGADPVPVAPVVLKEHRARIAHVFGASARQVRDYVASRAVKDLEADGFVVRTGSRFGSFVEGVALPFRPDSIEIARGVLKIAISYALQAGVPRGVIRHLVAGDRDILDDETQVRGVVTPYFPTAGARRSTRPTATGRTTFRRTTNWRCSP